MPSEDDGSAGDDHGPTVHDPEAELHEPEVSVDEPTVDGPNVPEPPSTGEADAPRELVSSFWILVLVANAVVLAVALGAMFVAFRGNWDLGGRLFLVGGVLGVYGYYRYRNFPDHSETDEDDQGDDADDAGTDEDAGDAPTVTDAVDTDDTAPSDGTDATGTAEDASDDGHPDRADVHPDAEPLEAPDPTDKPATAPTATVRDDDGDRYLLIERSPEASLVRDPTTGERTYLPTDALEPVEESPLTAATEGVQTSARRVLSATHDDQSLGLLVELVDRDAVPVRTLLSDYDLCESDLHGMIGEFRAAGLVEETTVAGERGYEATEVAEDGVSVLRATGRA